MFAGADTSDGQGGVVGAAVAVTLGPAVPLLRVARSSRPHDGGVRIHRISPTGYDVLEAPTPAVVMGTQLLGAPRYPSLRGIMQARPKPVDAWSLADLGVDAGVRRRGRGDDQDARRDQPPERAGATFVRETRRRGRRAGRRLPRRAEAHLMATIWAVGELVDGAPTKLTLELATLARQLAEASGGSAAAPCSWGRAPARAGE